MKIFFFMNIISKIPIYHELRMEILDIRIFLAIIRARSISKAAGSMHLSQSTISHRLKELEAFLGVSLLDRHKGRKEIKLTPEGERFVDLARKWTALYEETLQFKAGPARLHLAIGCVDSASYSIFPPFYRRLTQGDTPLELTIKTQHSPEIYSLLERDEINVGFVNYDARYANIIATPVLEERFCLLRRKTGDVPPAPVNPPDLDPARELRHVWEPEYQRWHDYWWNPGTPSVVRLNVASMLQAFLDDPTVWAIVPLSVAQTLCASNPFQYHDIVDPPPKRVVYCVTNTASRSYRSAAMQIFRRQLDAFLAERREQA